MSFSRMMVLMGWDKGGFGVLQALPAAPRGGGGAEISRGNSWHSRNEARQEGAALFQQILGF